MQSLSPVIQYSHILDTLQAFFASNQQFQVFSVIPYRSHFNHIDFLKTLYLLAFGVFYYAD
ncbi:hypothetical protein A6M27_07650 [Acidithiobacillus thiooxidans]|uniref:Uncharacterized protein n=1 Tax=Acidithiobacillus thiooxidans TaxID=930 RepID=A0A1C2I0T6_ACITH|nr:hypothetical protein A6O24_18260 [Acidithiobacillus thiooxidans]OCX70378.1 hypothetical protein A6P07_14560 [Acidithiobacillus thiooxidans]OCX81464.1 hypothetical protein A6O26_13185 [Acidithiobacillus thiooxidans]OCX88435.1 hypothetical protein A6M27_07650 [Acidithiobacillus thiooxidans]OFC40832.1 hypothetical protein BAE47_19300 [Acidithiobacillus thiooxidans]